MKVLIVSENFIKGGLETQIASTVKSLENKIDFYFAFGNFNSGLLKNNNIFTNFSFTLGSTISQFCEDVDRLIKIIKENNIDIVHSHPFFSFFPAVFAAKLCKIPVVYTYHGIYSYSFPCTINDSILYNMLMDFEVDKVFAVTNAGKKIMESILFEKSKSVFLPNLIDTFKFHKAKVINNKHWALISRLDSDKTGSIKKLLDFLPHLDIDELHIFGDGTDKSYLEEIVNINNLNNKVFFEGHKENIFEQLDGKFNGAIGIGRVVMESIAMGYPTILIGHNKISGLIDDNLYSKIKIENFTNKYLPDISESTLNEHLKLVYSNNYDTNFYTLFDKEFSVKRISNFYYEELKNIVDHSLVNLKEIYEEIKEENPESSFYSNVNIYNILRKYYMYFSRQPHQKNLFALADYTNSLNNKLDEIKELLKYNEEENQKNLQNVKTELLDFSKKTENELLEFSKKTENELLEFSKKTESELLEFSKKTESELSYLSQNTMTYKNFKNKILYKFKKNKQ